MGRIGVGFFYALGLEGYMRNPKPPNHGFGSKPPILVPSHPVPWLLSLLEFSLVEVPFNWLKVVVVFCRDQFFGRVQVPTTARRAACGSGACSGHRTAHRRPN